MHLTALFHLSSDIQPLLELFAFSSQERFLLDKYGGHMACLRDMDSYRLLKDLENEL